MSYASCITFGLLQVCSMTSKLFNYHIFRLLRRHVLSCFQDEEQWRQREFNIGGRRASPPGTPLTTGGRVWGGSKFFVMSKWYILVNSAVLNKPKFKLFLYLELCRWGSGRLFLWHIFKQSNEQKTSLNAVIGWGRLILVCFIRKYVITLCDIFPLMCPNQNIGGGHRGCVPGIPSGVDVNETDD